MVGPPFASRGVAALCFRRSRGPHVGEWAHILYGRSFSALCAKGYDHVRRQQSGSERSEPKDAFFHHSSRAAGYRQVCAGLIKQLIIAAIFCQ